MRQIEEKKSVILNFIMVVFLLTTICIPIVDYKIDGRSKIVLKKILDASNVLQAHTVEAINAGFAASVQSFPFDKMSEKNKKQIKDNIIATFENQSVKGKEIGDLVSKLKEGSIDVRDYYSRVTGIHDRWSLLYLNEYNKLFLEYRKESQEIPFWVPLKWVLHIIQLILIFVLANGYLRLLKDISNQIAK